MLITGHGDTSELVHDLTHPIAGINHVLAMVAVGLLAAQLGGRALWLVRLSFVGAMAIAGALGMTGLQIPFAEFGIALSIIVLGLAVAFRLNLPGAGGMAPVAFFAVFHRYVHGAEMSATASGLDYAAGFIGATALLHGFGVSLGLLIGLAGENLGRRIVQAGGGAIVLFGIAVLASFL